MLRPFCACSTIFCFCLLSFPHRFCHSKLVLFRFAGCFCLISSCISYCVCHFLWFGFSFLHAIPTNDTSYCSLFCLFILVFTPIFLYKRISTFMGQIMLTRSKGSWTQFVFICRSHSTRELYSTVTLYSAADLYSARDRFPLHFFLWTSLALWSSWWAFRPYFSLGFPPYGLLGMDKKIGINIQPPEYVYCSYNSYVKTYAVFFRGLFHKSHANASLLFFVGLLFQSLLSLGKSFSFFLQIYDLPRVAKNLLFMRVVVLLLSS